MAKSKINSWYLANNNLADDFWTVRAFEGN